MNKLVLVILSILIATSCVTQKRCLEKFPPTTDTIRIETVRDSIVLKDKLVEVYLPGEVRIDSVEIPCPEPPESYVPDTARARTDFAIAKAWFDYPNIKIELEQPDTTISWLLENALKEAYHWKTEYEKITVTPQPVKYVPTIYKISLWLWVGVIIAIIAYILFKVFIKR